MGLCREGSVASTFGLCANQQTHCAHSAGGMDTLRFHPFVFGARVGWCARVRSCRMRLTRASIVVLLLNSNESNRITLMSASQLGCAGKPNEKSVNVRLFSCCDCGFSGLVVASPSAAIWSRCVPAGEEKCFYLLPPTQGEAANERNTHKGDREDIERKQHGAHTQ